MIAAAQAIIYPKLLLSISRALAREEPFDNKNPRHAQHTQAAPYRKTDSEARRQGRRAQRRGPKAPACRRLNHKDITNSHWRRIAAAKLLQPAPHALHPIPAALARAAATHAPWRNLPPTREYARNHRLQESDASQRAITTEPLAFPPRATPNTKAL
jgi:hypothetical protein